jgi:hypothetical protein
MLELVEDSFSFNNKIKKQIEKEFINQKSIAIINIDKMIGYLDNEVKSFSQLFYIFDMSYSILLDIKPIIGSSLLYSLVSGTLKSMYSRIYTTSMNSKNEQETYVYINNSLKIVINFLNYVNNEINKYKI